MGVATSCIVISDSLDSLNSRLRNAEKQYYKHKHQYDVIERDCAQKRQAAHDMINWYRQIEILERAIELKTKQEEEKACFQ